MDAGARDVEVPAHERVIGGHGPTHILLEVFADLFDGRHVHTVGRPLKAGVFDAQRLEGRVAGPLADTQQRAVGRGAAVKPRRYRVREDEVEVVVAVELELVVGYPELGAQVVHQLRYAARQRGFRPGQAVAHRVADADLYLHPGVFREPHEPFRERDHRAPEVGPRHVLEVAPDGLEARLGRGVYDDHEVFKNLLPVLFEFHEDVVVRDGGQNAGLLQADVFDELEVGRDGADPPRNLRVLVPAFLALFERLPVLFAVEEELGLAYDALGAAEPVQQVVDVYDVVDGVRRPGLLAVAERRIRDPDVLRWR